VLIVIFSGFDFLSTSQEIGWEGHPKMTYLVSSGMLNINSIIQSMSDICLKVIVIYMSS